jgi:hypothetical protein
VLNGGPHTARDREKKERSQRKKEEELILMFGA